MTTHDQDGRPLFRLTIDSERGTVEMTPADQTATESTTRWTAGGVIIIEPVTLGQVEKLEQLIAAARRRAAVLLNDAARAGVGADVGAEVGGAA